MSVNVNENLSDAVAPSYESCMVWVAPEPLIYFYKPITRLYFQIQPKVFHDYIGKLEGALDLTEGILSKVGVPATEPGKWKIVASSSVFKTKGLLS